MTSILKADTIQDTDGNNIINENSNTITIGASGDTTNIIGTLQNNGAAVGGTNTPYFFAYRNASYSISSGTWTQIVLDAETLDTASGFNTSTGKYTIPSGQGGKYFLLTSLRLNNSGVNNEVAVYFFVNSSEKSFSNKTVGGGYPTVIHSDILSLNAGDTVFVKIYTGISSPALDGGGSAITTSFEGFKIST